jgi:hypothetical protein
MKNEGSSAAPEALVAFIEAYRHGMPAGKST